MRRNIEQAIVEEENERKVKVQRVKELFKEIDASLQVKLKREREIVEQDKRMEEKNKAYHQAIIEKEKLVA